MAGDIPKKTDKRKVIKLSTITSSPGKKLLSLQECELKDIKKDDVFIMLEGSLEVVMGKGDKFIWKAKVNAIQRADSYLIQAEEIG